MKETTMRRVVMLTVLGTLSAAFVIACGEDAPAPTTTTTEPAPPVENVLEPLPEPTVNMTKVVLGRRLFFETRLSGDNTISCASCHSLDHGGAEPRATSLGIRGSVGPINAPTVLNASLNFVQFWDGRADTLAHQASGPVGNPLEMGSTFDACNTALLADASYVAEFAALYPDGINEANITDAIAEYETSLITPGRFDRFLRGETEALTADERAGHELFTTIGCTSCHRGPGVGGTMYQRMGLVREYFDESLGRPLTTADDGRYNVTHDEADRHRFKVPLLRNVALTGPYFHDGSRATLEEAVLAMGRHQLGRDLDAEQVRLIVAFLGSLTGELPAHARMPAAEEAPPVDPTAPAADPTAAAPADPTAAAAEPTAAPVAPAPAAPSPN